jgi:hypothetical protein
VTGIGAQPCPFSHTKSNFAAGEWQSKHGFFKDVFTWPLYLEDFLAGTPVVPFERIDLVYGRGLNTIVAEQSGLLPPWPSDHVGVVSTVQLEP